MRNIQQIAQRIHLHVRQADEHPRIVSIVVCDEVCLRVSAIISSRRSNGILSTILSRSS